MARVDLLLVTGLTAGDGSIVSNGATLKFDSEFQAGTTMIKVFPKLYRNRELFESGYTHVLMSENVIPPELEMILSEDDYYVLTPLKLYEEVANWLNNFLGGTYFELVIIE